MECAEALFGQLVSLQHWLADNEIHVPLSHSSDTPEYLAFLGKLHVVASRLIPSQISIEQREELSDLVHRIISQLFRKPRTRHMFKLGYREAGARDHEWSSIEGVVNTYPNTLVNLIKSQHWRLLHQRLGDAVMQYLFMYATVFLDVGRRCLLQLTGAPAHTLGRRAHFSTHVTSRMARVSYLKPRVVQVENSVGMDVDVLLERSSVSAISDSSAAMEVVDLTGFESSVEATVLEDLQNASMELVHDPSTNDVMVDLTMDVDTKDKREDSPVRHGEVKHVRPRRPPTNFMMLKRYQLFYGRRIRQPFRLNATDATVLSRQIFPKEFAKPVKRTGQTTFKKPKVNWRIKQVQKVLETVLDNVTKCPYKSIMEDCCPRRSDECVSLQDHTLYHHVWRFCRVVLNWIFPFDQVWGTKENFDCVMTSIDRLIRARRFETLSLPMLMEGLKLSKMQWFLDSKRPQGNLQKTEFEKVDSLCRQFIWWLFQSFLIPLIKHHFYATETTPYRNRVFYYRHDVWSQMAQPALSNLCQGVFERVPQLDLIELLNDPSAGYAGVRLLPKESGLRPIVNLKRRIPIRASSTTMKRQLPSVNKELADAFQILTFEKDEHLDLMGASVLGMNGIYTKLKDFKIRHRDRLERKDRLYFAKVDIKSSFNTIKQDLLLKVIEEVVEKDEYVLRRFGVINKSGGQVKSQKIRRADGADHFPQFEKLAEQLAEKLSNAIVVDEVECDFAGRDEILDKIRSHIRNHLIRVGGELFRQVEGIPQGSVLSPLLCSLFYGHLEREKLQFVYTDGDCMLLRFVDDFLFIGFNRDKAIHFLHAMHAGHPEYGCFVNPAKTCTNFDVEIRGVKVENGLADTDGIGEFPWCGYVLSTDSLEISSDLKRYYGSFIADSLTIDYGAHCGDRVLKKLVFFIKPKYHAIFLDTDLNSRTGVLRNVYENLVICAMKFHAYVRGLPYKGKDCQTFYIDVLEDFVHVVPKVLRSRVQSFTAKESQCRFNVTHQEIAWLCLKAFQIVLRRKQSSYGVVLDRIDDALCDFEFGNGRGPGCLMRVLETFETKNVFRHIFY